MIEKAININPEDIHNNPMNNSTSKMLYSFSKQKRFHTDSSLDVPFYDLPSIKDKRSTSLGFGIKTCFEDVRGIPPPDKYHINR